MPPDGVCEDDGAWQRARRVPPDEAVPPDQEDPPAQGIWLTCGESLPDELVALLEAGAPDPGASVPGPLIPEPGWRQGGVLDQLEPGPELAVFLSGSGVPGDLDDGELIGVIRGWRRQASRAAAAEHAAIAKLVARRKAEAKAARCWDGQAGEYATAEVAAALTLTRTAACALVGRALSLDELPAVAAALASGRIDMPRALVIINGVSGLDIELARKVAAEVLPAAPHQTTGQLRAAVARAVIAADPAAAEKRREEAEKSARVEHGAEADGVSGYLAGRNLPVTDAVAAWNRVAAIARALKADGAAEPMDLLRTRVYLSLLLGRPAATAPGADDAAAGHDSPGIHAALAASQAGLPAGFTSPAGPVSPVGSVNLTVPLATVLGLADSPGQLGGFGPVTPGIARELAGAAAHDRAARWCVTVTDKAGQAIGHGCAIRECGQGPTGARAGDGDSDGNRSISDGGWRFTVKVKPLELGDCSHARESSAYRPSPSLRHLIQIRNQDCSFPGCRQPATRCDLDHTIPWNAGGKTCECNIAPLCRWHHKVKQAEGWRLEQPSPGILAWITPSGWKYVVIPAAYPT